jgi:hypothetical protein
MFAVRGQSEIKFARVLWSAGARRKKNALGILIDYPMELF